MGSTMIGSGGSGKVYKIGVDREDQYVAVSIKPYQVAVSIKPSTGSNWSNHIGEEANLDAFSLLCISWRGKVYKLDRNCVGASHTRLYCSYRYELEGGQRRRYTRRTISTDTGGSNDKSKSKTSQSSAYKLESTGIPRSKAVGIGKNTDSEKTGVKLSSSKLETAETVSDQHYVDLAKHATIICFHIETTGFSKENDRIIEIAFQDLRGGDNSTFESLVNPGRSVPNEDIHNISTDMVNRKNVPRMKELVPILLQYVRSRQLPGGIVVLVEHNGRSFNVSFSVNFTEETVNG